MSTTIQKNEPLRASTTCYGGENVGGFRIVRVVSCARKVTAKHNGPMTLAEANKWLVKNAAKVDAHAKASTQRLIGRDSV